VTIDTTKYLYTVKEACYLLAYSRSTVNKLIKAGQLRPIKLERSVRFSPQELERFVNERQSPCVSR
jgi:excisionase family DNA binding protein